MTIEINDVDRRIWEEELEGFLPKRIFDGHTHIYLSKHCLSDFDTLEGASAIVRQFPSIGTQELQEIYEALFPGREIHNLFFGWVFEHVDFDAINQFVAEQAASDPMSVPFMLTPPTFSPEQLAEQIDTYGFRGLKPYPFWTEKGWVADITDFVPEPLLEVANDKELIITLHLSKKMGVADEDNIKDLIYLSGRYPKVRWILAHCARSSVAWPLERAIDRIKDLPNMWYDVSTVIDSDVYWLMFNNVPLDRIIYGSDIPSDLVRGQMVGYAFAWALLTEEVIAAMDTRHCDGRPTYVVYETLRAARRAMLREGFDRQQIEDVFYNNAVKLLNP